MSDSGGWYPTYRKSRATEPSVQRPLGILRVPCVDSTLVRASRQASAPVPHVNSTTPTQSASPLTSLSDGPVTPDSKLLRVVGQWGLAASIVNITIGGGIFRLPAGVYARLGSASPVAYVVCAVLMGLIVTCFAEAGSRVSLTGGLYAYVDVAFGPLIGFISGFLLWAGVTAATAAVAVFFGDAVGALSPLLSAPLVRAGVIVTTLIGFTALNIAGVGKATRFNVVMTVAKLAPLAILVVIGMVSLRGDRITIAHAPALSDLGRGSIFLIFAFLGVESALVPSGEVKNPARTVPRSIAIALALVVMVYGSVQLVTQSALGPALADSRTPVADAGGVLLGAHGRIFILVGSAVSMFGYVSGMTLAVPRMLFAFGRDGFLPVRLTAVHARFHTPHVAIATQAAICIALATTGTFEELAIAANGSILIVYGACALAALQLRRRNIRSSGEPFVAPLGGLVPILAVGAIVWLLASLSGREWSALGVLALSAFVIFIVTQRHRDNMAKV
jgi:APA family basic amino acid/polyamine antiporter